LAERTLIEQITKYDHLKRHEIGHCNGWRHGANETIARNRDTRAQAVLQRLFMLN
jgi:hypothetical protein